MGFRDVEWSYIWVHWKDMSKSSFIIMVDNLQIYQYTVQDMVANQVRQIREGHVWKMTASTYIDLII